MPGPQNHTLYDAEQLADYFSDPRNVQTQRAAALHFDWSPWQYGHRLVVMKDHVLPVRGLAWHVTPKGVVSVTIDNERRWAAYARQMYQGAATGMRRLLTNTIEPAVIACPTGMSRRRLKRLQAQVAAAQASAEGAVDELDELLVP